MRERVLQYTSTSSGFFEDEMFDIEDELVTK